MSPHGGGRGAAYAGGVLRAALRPASLGLLAVALVLATAFTLLGQWQADRSRRSEADPALERVQPLTAVLPPATAFTGADDGQLVSATGAFVPEEQLLVPDRLQDGQQGSWVVAAFEVDPVASGGTAGDATAVVPVVRGWVPEGTAAADVAEAGTARTVLTGRLLAGEAPQGVAVAADGSTQVRAVSPADLLNVWVGEVYSGFVVQSDPAPVPPLAAVPTTAPQSDVDLRNVSYAAQWWLFAGLALVLWWRVVRDRFLDPVDPGATGGGGADDGGDGRDGGDGPGPAAWDDVPGSPPPPDRPVTATATSTQRQEVP